MFSNVSLMVSVNKYLLSPHCVLCLELLDWDEWEVRIKRTNKTLFGTNTSDVFLITREHISKLFFRRHLT